MACGQKSNHFPTPNHLFEAYSTPTPHVPKIQMKSSESWLQALLSVYYYTIMLGILDKNFFIFIKLLLLLTPFMWRSTLNSMAAGKGK